MIVFGVSPDAIACSTAPSHFMTQASVTAFPAYSKPPFELCSDWVVQWLRAFFHHFNFGNTLSAKFYGTADGADVVFDYRHRSLPAAAEERTCRTELQPSEVLLLGRTDMYTSHTALEGSFPLHLRALCGGLLLFSCCLSAWCSVLLSVHRPLAHSARM